MKKIKVSELPIASTLKGLFTLGVDEFNRSVKVSLQFVEDTTTAAVQNANEATRAAQTATAAANTAKALTEAATTRAKEETAKATAAAQNANTQAASAQSEAQRASTATREANTATENTKAATAASNQATEASQTATAESVEATRAAQTATEEVLKNIARLIPSALTVEATQELTWGNCQPVRIKAVLAPLSAMQNIIFISDNRAVEVSTDGTLTIIAQGVSRVHVIPTQNTALAKTLLFEVHASRLRLHAFGRLRFTQSGGFRFT